MKVLSNWEAWTRLPSLPCSFPEGGRSLPWRPEASCRSQDDLFLTGYLRSELLTHLAPELVSFMTRTAVLDRMCGPLAIAVARRSPARLVSFRALFWMTGGLLMLRFALAIRPRPGLRLGLAAAIAAVVGPGCGST